LLKAKPSWWCHGGWHRACTSASTAPDDDGDHQLKSLSCLELCLEIGFFGNMILGIVWVDGRSSNTNNHIWDWVDKIFDLSLCSTHVSLSSSPACSSLRDGCV
jgi:hypothetical protein